MALSIQLCHCDTIVKEGVPNATIVVREAAYQADPYVPSREMGAPDAKIKLAAIELQTYLEKITGAKVPLVSDAKPLQGVRVLVGPSKAADAVRGLKIPAGLTSERKEEGHVILGRGSVLVLAGNDEGPFHGTHYAVADFLRRQGVRWILPGDFGEVVPRRGTVEFQDGTFTDKPGFRLRTWWMNQTPEMHRTEALWKLRNKMQVADAGVVGIPGDSSLRNFLPDPELAKTRPELFGKKPDGTTEPHMPNLSNPEAAMMVAEKVVAEIRKQEAAGRKPHSLGFAPDDGRPMDHTPETMEKLNQGFTDMLGRAGVPTEVSTSEEWFHFVNQVAAHVSAVYPDFILTTNGYANRALPPEGMTLHPNLGIMAAFIWADTTKPVTSPRSWQGQVQGGQLKRWTELNPRVFLYEYNLTMLVTGLTPVPQVRKTAANYALYRKWGLMGFLNESRQPYMEEGIATRYMRAQLMWNPDLDLSSVLGDYYEKWYGPAAKPALAFWSAIEDALIESPMLGHEDRILPFVYTPALLDALERHAAEAEKLAGEEPYRAHVRIDRLTLEHLKAYMAYKAAEFDGRWGDAAAHLSAMIDRRMDLNKISPFLAMPPARQAPELYHSGDFYWGVLPRRDYFEKLHRMTSGAEGRLVSMAPREALFKLDEGSVGQSLRWHEPGMDRSSWRRLDTTRPFYLQGHLSPEGIPYTGNMWYVFELDVPSGFSGKPIRLHSPFVITQAWIWVNGQYAGHRKYMDAYFSPAPIDVDVARLVRPGKNTVAVWVDTGTNPADAAEGFLGRLFLYSPNDPAQTLPVK
ncbi:MAG TPA: DUF4838 domain-containing protein [Fimbriimonas sp.]